MPSRRARTAVSSRARVAGRVALVFALLAAASMPRAGAAEPPFPGPLPGDLRDLSNLYEMIALETHSEAYAKQREILEAIADLRTSPARARLDELLTRYAPGNPMRAVQLLGAIVRRGDAKAIDGVIRWVEARRDDLLLAMLPEILARALEPGVGEHLCRHAVRGAIPTVRAELLRAIGRRRDEEAWSVLLRHVGDKSLDIRVAAIEALADLGDPRGRLPVELQLRDPDPRVRDVGARALGAMKDPASAPALIRATEDDDRRVAESAALALGRIGDTSAVPALIDMLERHETTDLRLADSATDALRAISHREIGPDAAAWRSWWEIAKSRPASSDGPLAPSSSVPGPRYYDQPIRSSRVVFVVDVSRSMGWNNRLETAKQELVRTLRSLPNSTRFNVITFGDRAHTWKPEMVRATPAHIASAVRHVESLEPENGTNTHGALSKAFHEEDVDTIFLLSDGHPSVGLITDGDLIRMAVSTWNRFRRVRVHTLALLRGEPPAFFAGREDPSRAESFLRDLAADQGGTFVNVP